MSVQIFLSYSWKDNYSFGIDRRLRPGFVQTLCDNLDIYLDSADPKPEVWWDSDHIDEADQFDPKIASAIRRSSYFVVVLSRHWQESAYCQKELQLFRERWKDEDDFTFKHRIILVHKSQVPEDKRSPLLPSQQGLAFFSKGPRDVLEIPFFDGAGPNMQFYCVAQKLAEVLARRAKFPPEQRGWRDEVAAGDEGFDVRGALTAAPSSAPENPVAIEMPATRGKVYLAKPTAETQTDYLRLHKELVSNGYAIVPPAAGEILAGPAGIKLIDDALGDVVASIHLIGSVPQPGVDAANDVTSLQLDRAQHKATQQGFTSSAARPFHRIIWAPRFFAATERNPVDTLKSCSTQLASDRIEGDTFSRFLDSTLAYLDTLVQPPPAPGPSPDGQIYLCHDPCDEDYAFEVAAILAAMKKTWVMPVYANTSPQDRTRFHQENLARCASVMMCWANASEYWVKGHAIELANWRGLGRQEQFSHRVLIAGPPPDTRKQDRKLRLLFPDSEFDILLNGTTTESLSGAIRSVFASSAADVGPE